MAAVVGVLICGPDFGTSLKLACEGATGLIVGALLGTASVKVIGNWQRSIVMITLAC